MKRLNLYFLMVLFVAVSLPAESLVLTDVLKPDSMAVSADYLYVVEETSILVFKIPGFKFLKRFGKTGEGPMEFSRFVNLTAQKGKIWINSMGKLSIFNPVGEFIDEKKMPGRFRTRVLPFGDGYIGRIMQRDEESVSVHLAILDESLKEKRKVSSLPGSGSGRGPVGRSGRGTPGRSFVFPMTPFLMAGNGDRVAVAAWDDFRFLLVADQGKSVRDIEKKEWRRPELTASDKKEYEEALKRRFGTRWNRMRDRIQYAEFYPALSELFFNRDDLIVITWKQERGRTTAYRFKSDGTEAGALSLPIRNQNPLERYPFAIGNDRLYQLVENEDEEWILIVSPLDGTA